MTFTEAAAKYGFNRAYKMFGLTDHAVITIHPDRVELTCGSYHASEPTVFRHPEPQSIEQAVNRLQSSIQGFGITYEFLVETTKGKNDEDVPRIIDARIIALNETEYYGIDAEDKPHIEGIYGIYLYNKMSCTYLCEMTPSYHLIHIEDQVRLTQDTIDTFTEHERDLIYDKYENYNNSQDIYVHKSTIDYLEKQLRNKEFCYFIEGQEILPSDVDYDEYMDDLRDDCHCNSRL